MAEDTALLTPDTAPLETEAPEPELLTELDTAEVEGEGEDTGSEEPDTRDFEAELEDARKQAVEDFRKSYEEQAFLANRQREIQQARQFLGGDVAGKFKSTIAHFLEQVETGRLTAAQAEKQINPDNLVKGYVGDLASAVQANELAASDEYDNRVIASMYKDWRIPSDLLKQKELARQQLRPDLLRAVNLEIIRRAVLENEVGAEAKKLAEDRAQKSKEAARVAAVKQGDQARANADRPTSVSGGGSNSSIMTTSQIEAMPMAKWNALPQERRDYLLANAERADTATRRR